MKSYRRFLIMWNDEKYMMQAHEFVQDHLKNITSEPGEKGDGRHGGEKWVSFKEVIKY